ncbi:MAG: glutamate--tRNA ligase [Parcubacteria group bacterium]|nr:glutamate--tRNA ligase [Parcubacteria group bacterium]
MSQKTGTVITRFAPSPTGFFHIGSVRTALFNYAFARKNGGTMVLRIEDTDRERSKPEYEDDIIATLQWLGIAYEGPYRQSERTMVYRRYLTRLMEGGYAYESVEEKGAVIRFKNPNKKVAFHDIIRGDIEFDTSDLKDFVIARSIESPLYHLAVVIDDYEMGVTHVIRGEDHISNTPRQILIQEALGFFQPLYAHLPLVLAPDKSKLSKRNSKGIMIRALDYRKAGFLPEAILNFSALLGWSPQEEGKEVFTLDEFVRLFDLSRIQKHGAQFNIDKLRWLNKEHMKKLSADVICDGIKAHLNLHVKELPQYSEERLAKSAQAIFERIEVFADVEDLSRDGDLDYFFNAPRYVAPLKIISVQEEREKTGDTAQYLDKVISMLSSDNDPFTKERIKELLWDYATSVGRGNVLWPMRYALSGKDKSPDPFTLAEILGKEETLARIRAAKEELKRISNF